MNETYDLIRGHSPLLISMPHVGTHIPETIAADMTTAALQLSDVDWHLTHLYDMASALDASVLSAKHMRYVIDLNRPADDTSLYPGLDTTGLCPIDTFSKQPVYLANRQPTPADIQQRITHYWQPYHDQLRAELQRIKAIHGIAILFDAHSIASQVPRFFSGKLADLNLGTVGTQSCAPALETAIDQLMQDYAGMSHAKPAQHQPYSYVLNGRFKGGYITRHYGAPEENIHAVQLEISQCIYMQETPPFDYTPQLADRLKPLLNSVLATCIAWAHQHQASQAHE